MAKAATPKRYALALFQLAQEHGSEQEWLEDLRVAHASVSDATVGTYLSTPRISVADKLIVVKQILEELSPLVANLIGLLVSRQTLSLLGSIISSYVELLNISQGRVQAKVTSAVPVSPEQQGRLKESLGRMLGKEIVIHADDDPEIIGGMIIRLGDQVIDGSIRTRLDVLKHKLEHGSLT